MLLGLLLQAAGFAWIALIATATVSYTELILPFVIAGAGISMVLPATPTAALSAVPPADMGKASGVNNTLQRFGGVFGVAVVTAVFTATGHLGTLGPGSGRIPPGAGGLGGPVRPRRGHRPGGHPPSPAPPGQSPA